MKDLKLELRISSGTAKNKRLKIPNIVGFRAVQEKAKMSAFSIIGDRILGCKCLDLYAGSGNLGIEALSRGADHCEFVDESNLAIDCINENISNCGFSDKAVVISRNCVKYVAKTVNLYDIIFADPYYTDTAHVFLLKNMERILTKDGLIVFFHGEFLDIKILIKDTSLKIKDERKFGNGYFTILSA